MRVKVRGDSGVSGSRTTDKRLVVKQQPHRSKMLDPGSLSPGRLSPLIPSAPYPLPYPLAGRVVQYKDRVRLHLPSSCPVKALLQHVTAKLFSAPLGGTRLGARHYPEKGYFTKPITATLAAGRPHHARRTQNEPPPYCLPRCCKISPPSSPIRAPFPRSAASISGQIGWRIAC